MIEIMKVSEKNLKTGFINPENLPNNVKKTTHIMKKEMEDVKRFSWNFQV